MFRTSTRTVQQTPRRRRFAGRLLLRAMRASAREIVKYLESPASGVLRWCRMCDPLLERYRRDRDPRSLERIFIEKRALVASVARRYLRDPHDVDDVVQETL